MITTTNNRGIYTKKKRRLFSFVQFIVLAAAMRQATLSLSLSLICTVVSTSCDFLQPISSPRHSYKGELFVPLVQCVSTGRCPAERFIARNKLFPAKSSLITKRQSLCFHTLRRGTSAMFVYPSSVCFPHFSLSLSFLWKTMKFWDDSAGNSARWRETRMQIT